MAIFLAILMCFGFLLLLLRGLGFGYPAPAPAARFYNFGWIGLACFALVVIIKFWPV